jgi:hypothetical protein
MENINSKNKQNFTNIITQMTSLYNQTLDLDNEAYLNGKMQAYEDVLQWYLNNHNSDLQFINPNSFYSMMNEKLSKTKIMLNAAAKDETNETNKKRMMRFNTNDELFQGNGGGNLFDNLVISSNQAKKKKFK